MTERNFFRVALSKNIALEIGIKNLFEKFTQKAIKAIMLAQEEARRLGHNFVGTEQILLGLIAEGTGVAAKVLRDTGLNLKDVRIQVEKIIGRGSGEISSDMGFTKNAKYLLEMSVQEANDLGHNYVGTGHLLLGLLHAKGDAGQVVLSRLNLQLSSIRPLILQTLAQLEEKFSQSSENKPTDSKEQSPTFFERFTEKAIKVIMLAQEEARRLGHNFVGTEQILLGLIAEGTGVAAKVLRNTGLNLKDVRIQVEKIIGRGSGFVAPEIPFTPRAKLLLEHSLKEARNLSHNYIGTEHLLLGLLSLKEGVAFRILSDYGIDPSKAIALTIETLQQSARFSDSQPIINCVKSDQSINTAFPLKVFLAHANEDKKIVFELYSQLKTKGYAPWIDKIDLIPGQNWRSHIPRIIRESDVFIACFSENSVSKDGFVQKEFRLALNHLAQQPSGTIYLIPIRLDKCDIPDLRQEDFGINIRDIHWVDYWEENGFESLLKALEFVQKSKTKH